MDPLELLAESLSGLEENELFPSPRPWEVKLGLMLYCPPCTVPSGTSMRPWITWCCGTGLAIFSESRKELAIRSASCKLVSYILQGDGLRARRLQEVLHHSNRSRQQPVHETLLRLLEQWQQGYLRSQAAPAAPHGPAQSWF